MRLFYIALIAASGLYLAVQLVSWVFWGKVFFPDAGELFTDKSDKNMWQTVFPKNMLRLIIVIFAGSVAGVIMDAAGFAGWISLPLGAIAGIFVNFLISVIFSPVYDKFHKSEEPDSEELEGVSAAVVEEISDEMFGVISVKHGSKSYLMRAVTANGRFIPKGERVIVIYAQDGCCFVESEEHFCDVLFEEDNNQQK